MIRDRLFTALLAVLPQHALSRVMHRLTRLQIPWLVRPLIRRFVTFYDIDLESAAQASISAYPDINAFFTRALRPGARPLADDEQSIVSPVDAAISQLGAIDGRRLLQAKGRYYTVGELLADQAELGAYYTGGDFITLYLSPRDYHRIHMPADAALRGMRYVPGRLFAVNSRTTRTRDRLFARNERVICEFESARGRFALVMVGAIFVGGIDTVWSGTVTPAANRQITHRDAGEFGTPEFRRGAEIGRFNLGSTVILLFPASTLRWRADLRPGAAVRMGESIATYVESAARNATVIAADRPG